MMKRMRTKCPLQNEWEVIDMTPIEELMEMLGLPEDEVMDLLLEEDMEYLLDE